MGAAAPVCGGSEETAGAEVCRGDAAGEMQGQGSEADGGEEAACRSQIGLVSETRAGSEEEMSVQEDQEGCREAFGSYQAGSEEGDSEAGPNGTHRGGGCPGFWRVGAGWCGAASRAAGFVCNGASPRPECGVEGGFCVRNRRD